MNYEGWSKSRELVRTFRSDFGARDDGRTEENEESEGLRRPAHQGGMMGFELDRSRSNCVELDRTRTPPKAGKQSQKAYELRGTVEVGRTRSNFDTKFRGDVITKKQKRRFLNRRPRR